MIGPPADDAVQPDNSTTQTYTLLHRRRSLHSQSLIAPARFTPFSSEPASSVRRPSKWSPVSADWNRNELITKTSKTGLNFHTVFTASVKQMHQS